MMKIIDEAIPRKDLKFMLALIAVYLIVTVCNALTNNVMQCCYSVIGKKILISYQEKCINHLYGLSGGFYAYMQPGEMMTILMQDINNIRSFATSTFLGFISDALAGGVMIVFLAFLQWELLAVILIFLPPIFIVQKVFREKIMNQSQVLRECTGRLSSLLQGLSANIISHVIMKVQSYFYAQYKKTIEKNTDLEVQMAMVNTISRSILSIIAAAMSISILGYGGYKIIMGTFTVGGLMAFHMYSQGLIAPIMRISNVNMMFQSVYVSMDRIYSFLSRESDISLEGSCFIPERQLSGKVAYCNVSFSYGDVQVLRNINMNFMPAKLTAIVGESGEGKSTILNLLYRLWDVEEGKIEVDGRDIRTYDLNYIRSAIMVVRQDTYLIDDTIYNNIVLGNPNGTEQRFREVCRIACVDEFAENLKDKYHTQVGENGSRLSGGQNQRIAIARALFNDAPVLILDEATSALDQIMESKILYNIRKSLYNKTVVMITHRLSTIRDADMIYVMNDHGVCEAGTHEELMESKGNYYCMVRRKFEGGK
ncbi:MAG: ABC transporter ATP-binding protein/permease [Blautia sp.]|nr:ABC transporter ATP-binding protein/permease [Blautia sp.]